MHTLSRATVVWIGFFALAFVNGALRELLIQRLIDEPWAHHLSALTGIAMFTVYLRLVWHKTMIRSFRSATWIGAYWLILTVLAETFIVGRMMSKQSWSAVIQNYNVARGNLWPFVLAWVSILPSAMLWWKRRSRFRI